MAARAELKARLTLNKSLFDRGIAGATAGAARLGAGLRAASRVGTRGFTLGAAAVAGLTGVIAIGTKKAFDLGGRMVDIGNLTGKSAKQVMVMRRALMDAGVSMEKIDTYMVTGRDRGNVIARTLANLTQEDWASAAASVGTQADILNRSAAKFDKVSDLLGHSGEKFQGFFVGVADRVAGTLLPILERFDKADFAGVGQKFGNGLVQGARVLMGFFNDPRLLFGAMESYFRAAALGMGNVLIAAFKTSLDFFKNGLLNMLQAIGSAIIATMMEAFATPISYLQAGIEAALARIPKSLGGTDEAGQAKQTAEVINKQLDARIPLQNKLAQDSWNGVSGAAEKYAEHLAETARLEKEWKAQLAISRGKLPTVAERAARIRNEGVQTGLGSGMTAAEWRANANTQANTALDHAGAAARNFKVNDVLGAGSAMNAARRWTVAANQSGARTMPVSGASDPHGYAAMAAAQRSRVPAYAYQTGRGAGQGLISGGSMSAAYNQSGNIWRGRGEAAAAPKSESTKDDPSVEKLEQAVQELKGLRSDWR